MTSSFEFIFIVTLCQINLFTNCEATDETESVDREERAEAMGRLKNAFRALLDEHGLHIDEMPMLSETGRPKTTYKLPPGIVREQPHYAEDEDEMVVRLMPGTFAHGTQVKVHSEDWRRVVMRSNGPLSAAILWAYVGVPQGSEAGPQGEDTFVVSPVNNQIQKTSQAIENQTDPSRSGWIQFDITRIANQHIHRLETALALQTDCKRQGGCIVVDDEHAPFISYKFRQRYKRDITRTGGDCSDLKCCLQSYTLNVTRDLPIWRGVWISPALIAINYCKSSGAQECVPKPATDDWFARSRSCCRASEFDNLQVVFKSSNAAVISRNMPYMIAKACICM